MESKYAFYPQHLHLHSCYEPGASMEGHIYHASRLGMKYIWFTDHDIRMGRKPIEFEEFDFSSGLTEADEEGELRGFKPTDRSVGSVDHCTDAGRACMKLSVKSDGEEWSCAEAILFSNGKSHCTSLLSDVSVGFAYKLRTEENDNLRLVFDFKLSERPPEGEVAHILYVAGSTDGLDAPHTLVKKIDAIGDWVDAAFHLSKDATDEVGGLDNTFDNVTVRLEAKNGCSAAAYIADFTKTVRLSRNETRENQKRVADIFGKKYGVTPFVATEISCAGMHKNLFSTSIPIIDYDKANFKVSHEQACRYAVENGGTFALNHPFSIFKRTDLSTFDMEEEVAKRANYFAENNCFGAKLIEVGFPRGRYAPLEWHLRLWDRLSLDGHFLTGYGCNDAHSIKYDWYSGSNFVGFFGVNKEEIPTEESIVEAMRAGRAYTADPVRITGNVSFATSDGVPMGGVVSCSIETTAKVLFRADNLKPGMAVKWIINGENARQTDVVGEEIFGEIDVKATLPVSLARVEIYDADGKLILLTNPIYLVREDLASIEIPAERKYSV